MKDIETHPNKRNWASSVRSLLQTLGINELWLFQCFRNINIFLSLFIQRIEDTFKGRMWDLIVSVPDHCLSFYFVQNWNDRLSNSR